jgi:hypothetical protein
MKGLITRDSFNNIIAQKSMTLVFVLIMVIMASNSNSEVNVRSETARLVGTLRAQVIMGSSPHEVMEILQRHHIEHTAYQEEAGILDAIVRDVVKLQLGSTSIKIRFLFEDERLSSYTLEKRFTRN